MAGEERCRHGEIAAWCGESDCLAARSGMLARVWRTPQGQTYHHSPACEALTEGQRLAGRRGLETLEPQQVPLADAMADGLGECFHCFPPDVPVDAKRCRVLVDGRWADGFLLEWQRGADGRWKGRVNYRHDAGRREELLDQDRLRPG